MFGARDFKAILTDIFHIGIIFVTRSTTHFKRNVLDAPDFFDRQKSNFGPHELRSVLMLTNTADVMDRPFGLVFPTIFDWMYIKDVVCEFIYLGGRLLPIMFLVHMIYSKNITK